MPAKPITLNGQALAGGRLPAICAPLVARTRQALQAEVAQVAAKRPDLLEWRVDFFEHIADTAAVVEVAGLLRAAAGAIPLLFTRRSMHEGGETISLREDEVVALYRAVCDSGHVQCVDFEMSNDPAHLRELRACSRANGQALVLSFHDFQKTPELDFLLQRFTQAAQLQADVAKVAVMPQGMDDVLRLLSATLHASEQLDIPVVSMAMGGFGAITRLSGWAFGSALSFAIGQSSSAPGQLPIDDLRAGVALLRKAMGQGA